MELQDRWSCTIDGVEQVEAVEKIEHYHHANEDK